MSTTPPPQDHYKVLGVAKDAELAAIRTAYRKLVITTHPDKFPDEAIKAQKADEFHRVQQAYETLSDEKARSRYHAEVRLAELKAERAREEYTSRRTTDSSYSPRQPEPTFSPRSTAERSWTAQPIVEEIRPRNRYYDESRSAEPRPSPRYEEYRPRAREYDDYDGYDDFVPAHSSSKKANGTSRSTLQEDTNKARSRWKTAASKVTAEKVKEREAEDRRKNRDKGRRDDTQQKRTHVRIPINDDSGSEMEPELAAFINSASSHKKSERPRSYEDDKHRSRRKHESRGSSPDRETKTHHNFQSAAEYIAKSIGKVPGDRDHTRRRPSLSRGQSSSRNQIPPPPPAPPVPPIDDAVRSSARRPAVSRSSKSSRREPLEIVEPRKRDQDNDSRRPSLNSSMSSQSTLKPLRSATMETRGSDRPKASFRRVATSPLAPMGSTSHSHKSSKLKDSYDSGYSSPGTPDITSPRTTKTSYKVQVDTDSEAEGGIRPQYILIDPDQRRHASQEPTPRSASYRGERSSSSRHGPSRSHTVDETTSSHRPPPLSRAATERSGMLYGEVPSTSPDSRAHYPDVRRTPRYEKGDVNFSPFPRRPSPSEKDSRNDHRDAYEYGRRGSIPLRQGKAQEV